MTDNKEIVKGEEVILEIKPGMNILEVNKQLAQKNKELLQEHNVKAIDIMGSIGAGKSSRVMPSLRTISLNSPIPVLTPYMISPASIFFSSMARQRSMRASASGWWWRSS